MTSKKMRRSGRLFESVPILLIGSDCEGRVFSEQTRTVVLSLHGAGVVSSYKLVAEQELFLRSVESNREAEIRIVGEIGSQEGRYTYGVTFLDDDLDFWQMEFPMPPLPKERPSELVLECTGCSSTVTMLHGDYEFDVCAIHGGLVRYCAKCEFTTVWKRPDAGGLPGVMPANPQKIPPRKMALTEGIVTDHGSHQTAKRTEAPTMNAIRTTITALEERRQRVRAKVSYFACVRTEAFGQDVVACTDMSRGGLAFRTKNAYLISAEVKIAVPFSPDSPNAPAIYVAARVVNVTELRELKMFRCGVAFLPVAGARAHT
jgi:hypothetical protein